MKVIGLIGGTSYKSTIEYYRLINANTNLLLGEHKTPEIVIASLNFQEIVDALYSNNQDYIIRILINAAQKLKLAGADFIIMCCNTLHKFAPAIEKAIQLPLLHILLPTGQEIKKYKINKVGLLGTEFTMNDIFHKNYLWSHFQIESIVPNEVDRQIINAIIFDELCHGNINNKARKKLSKIIQSLEQRGAQGIILGCTELPLLLPLPINFNTPIFNTTALHTEAAINYALASTSRKEADLQKKAIALLG